VRRQVGWWKKIKNVEEFLMQMYKRERLGELKITNSWRCIFLRLANILGPSKYLK
jgi:hypothetical protein